MLFSAPGFEKYVSGVILFDETLRSTWKSGTSFAEMLRSRGVTPGIKVDAGTRALDASPNETFTQGLDGLA